MIKVFLILFKESKKSSNKNEQGKMSAKNVEKKFQFFTFFLQKKLSQIGACISMFYDKDFFVQFLKREKNIK